MYPATREPPVLNSTVWQSRFQSLGYPVQRSGKRERLGKSVLEDKNLLM